MKYSEIVRGTFVSRPNRFIARVEIEGTERTVHVKNTGRCRELLVPGAAVLLERCRDYVQAGRKTEYSLVAVYKGKLLINMDSQAPNQAAEEWLRKGGLGKAGNIRREVTYGSSRFDLAFTMGERPAFMEVKGVTLEQDGVVLFPDAPTQRGVKHLRELSEAAGQGYLAYLLFVIQMKGVTHFAPNRETHAEFADVLRKVSEEGVRILAYDCLVREDGFEIDEPVPVVLE